MKNIFMWFAYCYSVSMSFSASFKLFWCIWAFGFVDASRAAATVTDQKCPSGQHWVRSHSRSAYTRSDGIFVSATLVQAHCQGDPPAYAVWNSRLKSGFPPKWQNKTEKSKAWTDEEKERVLEALSELPEPLLVKSVEGIYRLEKYSGESLNPAAGFKNDIALYDEAFRSKQNLSRVLGHEFAHKLYGQFFDGDRGKGYADAAEWQTFINPQTKEHFLTTLRDNFVEEDGVSGPDEDFCNNIEYFLFDPEKLKTTSPKIYDWIQNKYGAKFKLGKGSK